MQRGEPAVEHAVISRSTANFFWRESKRGQTSIYPTSAGENGLAFADAVASSAPIITDSKDLRGALAARLPVDHVSLLHIVLPDQTKANSMLPRAETFTRKASFGQSLERSHVADQSRLDRTTRTMQLTLQSERRDQPKKMQCNACMQGESPPKQRKLGHVFYEVAVGACSQAPEPNCRV